jgi:creatinine amidohydrolase
MVQLAEKSWPEAGELFEETDIAILPVGSTEQHGPHNPLGTDHLIAARMAFEVGERTGVPVLPVVPVGVSAHHRQFPGTLWVPPGVFRGYIKGIALAAASHGVRKVLVVNGHGGNTTSLMEVTGELREEHGVFTAVASAFPPMDGHAGEGETSANLYFHGHLVRMDRAVDTKQNKKLGSLEVEGFNYVYPGRFAWDTMDLSPTGVMGSAGATIKSTTASGEKGRELMEPYIDELCALVEEMKKADIEGLLPKPHK